jgi:GTP-binding protein EngB required for normal cell division
MTFSLGSRLVRAVLIVLVLSLCAAVMIIAANQLFALDRALDQAPVWVRWSWWGGFALALGLAAYGLFRFLFPGAARPRPADEVPDEAVLRAELGRWQAQGVDVAAAAGELAELEQRRSQPRIVVSVHGEISSGKSSLIRALVPDAQIETGVIGGTTRRVTHYDWQGPDGERLLLADVPGFGGADPAEERLARDEAGRAHLVLFVCEGDLSRSEWRELEALRSLGKPLVVAVNKSDAYDEAGWRAVHGRLAERLGADVPVVAVVAGGRETVLVREADGRESERVRERPPDLRALRRALQRAFDTRGDDLEALRDRAVFLMTARKLEGAVREHRRDAADALVERYARRAMGGAMAAVAPGSDLVIQGALAAGLVRELCRLYDVEVRAIALDRLVAGLRERAGNAAPLLLGVAGNALKAFPGVGTLTGGLVHVVAYGLLFRSVGRALAESLEQRGELRADDALARFEESLGGNLETPARKLARLALERDLAPRDGGRRDPR